MSIIKHEFSDDDINTCPSRTGRTRANTIYLELDHRVVYLDKKDAIAIAKHFSLSEEDLK